MDLNLPNSFPEIFPPDFIKKAVILFNTSENGNWQEKITDSDTLEDVCQVRQVLESAGIAVELFELDETNVGDVKSLETDFIFNLCYGIGNLPDSEEEVYRILDLSGLPYSGGPLDVITLTNDKAARKNLYRRLVCRLRIMN